MSHTWKSHVTHMHAEIYVPPTRANGLCAHNLLAHIISMDYVLIIEWIMRRMDYVLNGLCAHDLNWLCALYLLATYPLFSCVCVHVCVFMCVNAPYITGRSHTWRSHATHMKAEYICCRTRANGLTYEVASISRLLKIIGLFCRI